MRRLSHLFVTGLALCALATPAWSVTAPVQPPSARPGVPASGGAPEHIKLGDSAVDLGGPWKFHTGDDPSWAAPGFDDSRWDPMDLTAGPRGYIPGWTARGYPGYSGFAWYRLKVEVDGGNRGLALKMPEAADDAYQVFVNGTKVGEFGKFGERKVVAYGSIPIFFRLPKGVANGPISIAIRMWMDTATPFNSPDAGGLHAPPVLGYAARVAADVRLDFDNIAHSVGSGFLEMLILFMAFLMAGALYWLDPSEKAYLWLALVCTVTLLGNSIVLLANFTTPMGQTSGVILADVFAVPIRIGLWVIFWGYWFRLYRIRYVHFVVWSLVALLAIGTAMLRPPLYGERIPVEAARYLIPILLIIKLSLGVLLLIVAFYGFKRQKTEGGMAVAAVLFAVVGNFQRELRLLHLQTRTVIFGFSISVGTVSTIVSLLIITVMLLRRFIASQRRKELWKLEIEQARQVQQVLIPEKLPVINGLKVLSEYRPAREVGGDFFQILPPELVGDTLIVVGDVTGKGLQAGMLVALIVGAARNAAHHTSEPAQILSLLNDQLCERDHASATCIVLRIGRDGAVDLAHAGHLPPYLNGKEMELEGALPLGVICGIDFASMSFQLKEGDSLILMSDGIVEAQDPQGRLFGFDRINELLAQQVTPADIANAAQKFGQEDDILVLELQWSRAAA